LFIIQSVLIIVVATEAAFFKALLVTNKGSIIPALTISTVFPVTTSNPCPLTSGMSYDSTPALLNITSNGFLIAQYKTSSPMIVTGKHGRYG
jgi:hypothetical protein